MERKRNQITWSPAARRDVLDIWRYFARVVSPESADKLLDEIQFTLNRLIVDPRMYRVRSHVMPELQGGLRSAPVHPYAIFYRIDHSSPDDRMDVQIIRVRVTQASRPREN
jgi:plasmid stabilization system protein ParE